MIEKRQKHTNQDVSIPVGWIYDGDSTRRFVLGQPGKKNMLVFGVNPSTAKPGDENIDPTIRKVRKLLFEAGYDGWIMVNLYPLRSTDPSALPAEEDKALTKRNLDILKALCNEYQIDAVWAAWGNMIDTRPYLSEILSAICKELPEDLKWYHCGPLTKTGNPRHPLYLKSGEPFVWFHQTQE